MKSRKTFRTDYRISASSADEAKDIAESLCIEQSVEIPLDALPESAAGFLGRLSGLEPCGEQQWEAAIDYSTESVSGDPVQFLNVLYGNCSLYPGICVTGVDSVYLNTLLQGPSFGIKAIRTALSVPRRALSCTALKPIGLSPDELAERAFRFTKGGIDIIKDDHGLTSQASAPFRQRVTACVEAVRKGEQFSGKRTLYFPNITTSALTIGARFEEAAELGADGVMICPQLTGLETMHALARKKLLPVMAHPSFSGAYVLHPDHGFSPAFYYGTLWRAFGADMIIYPNAGGRFSFDAAFCKELNRRCREELEDFKPSFPSPGGGIDRTTVSRWLAEYGNETLFLIGGSLYQHPGGEEKAAIEFQQELEKNEQ